MASKINGNGWQKVMVALLVAMLGAVAWGAVAYATVGERIATLEANYANIMRMLEEIRRAMETS